MPDGVAKSWLEAAHPRMQGHQLVLGVPHATAKQHIENRYRRFVEDILAEVTGESHDLIVEVRPDLSIVIADDSDVDQGTTLYGTTRCDDRALHRVRDEISLLNPTYVFDTFVLGESNQFAAAAAVAVAEQPANSYNPLFIYGEAGLGKTHLLHAIGNYVRRIYPEKYVRYTSTEMFLDDFIEAVRTNSQASFKLSFRHCDLLLIDDVQLIENREQTQEEFFHIFDYLHSSGRQIVISSDRPPKAMATLEGRLRSRFGWGLVTDIQPPRLETRLAILRRRAALQDAVVTDDVLVYIATHLPDNIRELEGALNRVTAFSSLNSVPLTLQMAENVLGDLIATKAPHQVTAKNVMDATAEMFGFTVEELCSKSRSRSLVTARQVAMYVLREMTDFSYAGIGRAIGDREDTTVIHGVSKIGDLMRERGILYEQVTELTRRIGGG